MLTEVLGRSEGGLFLDIGCGTGHIMALIDADVVHGLDISSRLVSRLERAIVGDALDLPMRDSSYDGVYSVLTLEHLRDHTRFFEEAGRVTKSGGVLAIVVNHPFWTASGSTPIQDADGEILWRQGEYFSAGATIVPAGDSEVAFYHRPLAELLNSASSAGWSLEHMTEQPHPGLEDQFGILRLLACRWRLLP